MKWQGNTRLHLVVCCLSSATVASSVAYVVAMKILEKKFQERLGVEIQDAKAYYQEIYSQTVLTEPPSKSEEALLTDIRNADSQIDAPPEDLVGNALRARQIYEANVEEEEEERPVPVVVNIFNQPTPPGEAVIGALMADRDPSKPYIITREEFFQNEPDHEQVAFTYWEEDNVLVDDREEFQPFDNHDLIVGEDNLLRFGYGSEDQNVLYVRNEAVDPPMDIHITKSTGKYAIEVMSFDNGSENLQHSQKRFKLHDE